MSSFKIFYSWQSDRDSKLCRNFIRIALEAAAAETGRELNVEVSIDSDTQDVPGTPPITETILRKIRDADFFLGDMTFVGRTENGKQLPNPNVMGEYGYALRDKGSECILLTMNTAFGPPEDLPFDLGHLRHPAQYELSSDVADGERRQRRSLFAGKLAGHLSTMVRSKLERQSPDLAVEERAQAEAWVENLITTRISKPAPVVVSCPQAAIHFIPFAALKKPDLEIETVNRARSFFCPESDARAEHDVDHTQWWSYAPIRRREGKPNPESEWCCRLIRPGAIEWTINIGNRFEDDAAISIEGSEFETMLIKTADRASQLAEALGLTGSAIVSVSLFGIEGVEIIRPRKSGKKFKVPNLPLGSALIPAIGPHVGNHMRPILDTLWLASGFDDGSTSYRNGAWTGYLR